MDFTVSILKIPQKSQKNSNCEGVYLSSSFKWLYAYFFLRAEGAIDHNKVQFSGRKWLLTSLPLDSRALSWYLLVNLYILRYSSDFISSYLYNTEITIPIKIGCQAVVRPSSGIFWAVIRWSSDGHQRVIRGSSEGHQTVIRQS